MMPYLIATKPPEPNPGDFNDAMSEAASLLDATRRAVATLEEAREAARSVVVDHGALELQWDTALIPEAGGAITLPDGTVIEVTPATYDELYVAAGLVAVGATGEAGQRAILDAFNARQGPSA